MNILRAVCSETLLVGTKYIKLTIFLEGQHLLCRRAIFILNAPKIYRNYSLLVRLTLNQLNQHFILCFRKMSNPPTLLDLMPVGYGYIIFVAVSSIFLNLWLGFNVMKARKQFKVQVSRIKLDVRLKSSFIHFLTLDTTYGMSSCY